MTGAAPVFAQVNLVITDMDATLAFYRTLGLVFAEHAGAEWPPGSGARHAEVVMPDGLQLEFDNEAMAVLWHRGRRRSTGGSPTGRSVIGFAVRLREDVDRHYATLTAAGHAGRQEPYDAFWGGRYAIVADPDGNECGIGSPADQGRAYVPHP